MILSVPRILFVDDRRDTFAFEVIEAAGSRGRNRRRGQAQGQRSSQQSGQQSAREVEDSEVEEGRLTLLRVSYRLQIGYGALGEIYTSRSL
jgi:hypothetical protein